MDNPWLSNTHIHIRSSTHIKLLTSELIEKTLEMKTIKQRRIVLDVFSNIKTYLDIRFPKNDNNNKRRKTRKNCICFFIVANKKKICSFFTISHLEHPNWDINAIVSEQNDTSRINKKKEKKNENRKCRT